MFSITMVWHGTVSLQASLIASRVAEVPLMSLYVTLLTCTAEVYIHDNNEEIQSWFVQRIQQI
jgi:hypothetical protein